MFIHCVIIKIDVLIERGISRFGGVRNRTNGQKRISAPLTAHYNFATLRARNSLNDRKAIPILNAEIQSPWPVCIIFCDSIFLVLITLCIIESKNSSQHNQAKKAHKNGCVSSHNPILTYLAVPSLDHGVDVHAAAVQRYLTN